MTVTAWLLIVLGVTALAGAAAFLVPVEKPEPHPYVTDPAETEHEHEGRHRNPYDQDGPTRRLGDSRMRHPRG